MSIRLGNNPVIKLSVGAQIISRVYVGANIVYSGEWSPIELFANNEPGVWYDPSDFSTMFQDAAGTVPVTAVEQPVGRILDKSGRGFHATQATATSRPVLSARVNLLTKTEDISSVGWSGYDILSRTATKFVPNATNGEHYVANSVAKPTGAVQYTAKFDVKDEGYGFAPVVVGDWMGVSATNGWYFCIRLSDGTHTTPMVFGSGWATGTVNITRNAVTGICTVTIVFTTSSSTTRVGVGVYAHPSLKDVAPFNFSGNGTSGIYLSKMDLRPADQAHLPYQRVNTATDYDTAGFPHYLRFDGVDDFLVTPTITPGIDKAQVFAGVRKLSDAAPAVVAETSVNWFNYGGAMVLTAPTTPAANYGFNSRGSIPVIGTSANTFAAPTTSVLSGQSDISGDLLTLRVNGVQAAQRTVDQGTGNYLAYPLYIGRRAGTSNPFNGHLYSLIVRFGSNLPIATIEQAEAWINSKTGAY